MDRLRCLQKSVTAKNFAKHCQGFFSEISNLKMCVKMNLRIITENEAADQEI